MRILQINIEGPVTNEMDENKAKAVVDTIGSVLNLVPEIEDWSFEIRIGESVEEDTEEEIEADSHTN
jgi:hypothetical protein